MALNLTALKDLKLIVAPILEISRPIVKKIIDEKIIPAAKTWIYTSLQKKKDKAVNKLLVLVTKYNNETDETKKQAHKVGLDLGLNALKVIGTSMVEAAQKIESEIK